MKATSVSKCHDSASLQPGHYLFCEKMTKMLELGVKLGVSPKAGGEDFRFTGQCHSTPTLKLALYLLTYPSTHSQVTPLTV